MMGGKGQKLAGDANTISGQSKKYRKVITLEQKLDVCKWYENNKTM
jgi:hypothetical protein